mmetsp:Transcript_10563/g.30087  ORF Transcript_10563/g.30087 Transcript_10563/m.30087 type:complete len:268 (-) Transcript_10563:231-1034(-)
MVLDLVVKEAVRGVNEVAPGREVGGGDNSADVEGATERLAVRFPAVHVGASVVWHDDDEGVDVGEDVREQEVDRRVGEGGEEHRRCGRGSPGPAGQARQQEGEGLEQKLVHRIGQQHVECQLCTGNELGGLPHNHTLEGHCAVEGGLGTLRLEVGKSVGGVVEPLPGGHEEAHHHILEQQRHLHCPDVRQVVDYQVRVCILVEMVVVEVIVFQVPCLGQHPVRPVAQATEEGPCGKVEPVPAPLGRAAILVPAVRHVVAHHSPAPKG